MSSKLFEIKKIVIGSFYFILFLWYLILEVAKGYFILLYNLCVIKKIFC